VGIGGIESTESCEAGGVLLLPPLDADPLRDTRAEAIMRSCKRITYYSDSRRPPVCEWQNRARPALVNFGEVFDLQHFASRLRPSCVRLGGPRTADIMAVAPPPGASIVTHNIHPLHATWWDMRKYGPMLREVYAATQLGAAVQPLLDALLAEAVARAGPRWASIHLPIEMDWWWSTDFCQGRADENFTRRCYTPSEVARLARPALRRRNVTGIVLLYAHDKVASLSYPWRSRRVNRTGPHVCHCDFGPRTFKLQLNASIP